MKCDAKVIEMILDLSDRAIHDLMADYGMVRGPLPDRAVREAIALRYRAGLIESSDIVAAWEGDDEV